ncbi:putative 3', 5'-cyclic nucleotide phosphodiesterase domain-containing protein [Neospora caninum Liverpool]|uniref:Phosphodiesterase n=1 Tax=Neospora caninum (strain Liverpool) TaxID=572307 RepID=F0V717_NEOCL|nr:putative 3', 5'-cyclic nucleotide phosphodiesterase domain-containing protein [Neospora caninum Liverpool]CBZ49508.1 putative 3', 5'-cyclic nucleotide phosphodiesterase domain-containing protein [Neospora caninum Liverpool]CEL64087.1 TPA: 3', 5'-cyclic nucleotide phosphodiesterase domain-containing protein, putative [Neospora caninum Liverpool]|eukprot:XP_003879543.1 putative 3', 5'-cyclic nucleotide phosphodiesterase domain-containing protein [Neospora caninum Liverpool]
MSELPPRRRRSSLIHLEENYGLSGFASRPSSRAGSSALSAPSAGAESPSVSPEGLRRRDFFPPSFLPGSSRSLPEPSPPPELVSGFGRGRARRDGDEGDRREREGERGQHTAGRKQAERGSDYYSTPLAGYSESRYAAPGPFFRDEREEERRRASRRTAGMQVGLHFYDCIGQQLRTLQVLCDRQKAEALRAPVEAACSKEASMISFGRTVAGTVSAALGCPLVLVCAYDKETDELYCCFASIPLGTLCPSSPLSPLASPPFAAANLSPADASARSADVADGKAASGAPRCEGETLMSRASSLQTYSRVSSPLRLPPASHLPRAPETDVDSVCSYDRSSSSSLSAGGACPQLSPPSSLPSPLPSCRLPAQFRRASARQMGFVSSPRREQRVRACAAVLSTRLPRGRERSDAGRDMPSLAVASPRTPSQATDCEGLREENDRAAEAREEGRLGERGHAKMGRPFRREQDGATAREMKEGALGTGDRQLESTEGSPKRCIHSSVWSTKNAEKEQTAGDGQQRGSMSRVDLEELEADAEPADWRRLPELAAEGDGISSCGRLESEEEILSHQLRQFLRWRLVDDRRASDTASFARSSEPPESPRRSPSPRKAEKRQSPPLSNSCSLSSPSESSASLPAHLHSGLAGAMMERRRQSPPSPFHFPRWGGGRRGARSAHRLETERALRSNAEERRVSAVSAGSLNRAPNLGTLEPVVGPREEELPFSLRYVGDPTFCDCEEGESVLEGREVLVLSPRVGCIGELFQRVNERTTQSFLYDSTSDAIIGPQRTSSVAAVPSGPVPSDLVSVEPSEAASSSSSFPACSSLASSALPHIVVNALREKQCLRGDGEAGLGKGDRDICAWPPLPPLRLLVRKLTDRAGSRLWDLMEDSRIDYSLPPERKRGPLEGTFGRKGDVPSRSSFPRKLAPHAANPASARLSDSPARSTAVRKVPSSSSMSSASSAEALAESGGWGATPPLPRSPSVAFLGESREDASSRPEALREETHATHPNFAMGLLVCVQPLDGGCEGQEELIDEIADRVEQLLLSVLNVEWLRRERTKKALQLELHRSVFQEALNPIKTVERFLSLIHTTLGVEQVAFFIVDAQNNSFVCLGGALQARGLTLPHSHPLLGEATRQGGRIAICNDVPAGMNKDYDDLAGIRTRSAMVVPLLNAQGFAKGVLLLINRPACALCRPGAASFLPSGSYAPDVATPFAATPRRPTLRHAVSSPVALSRRPNPTPGSAPTLPAASPFFLRPVSRSASLLPDTGAPRESASQPQASHSSPSRLERPRQVRGRLGDRESSGFGFAEASDKRRGREGRGRARGDRRAGDRGETGACPLCSPAARHRLSYGDQLLQTLTVANELKVHRKFTREDEVFLRCIQCEIQNALGGALTNVCVAGMTLLKPMVTMVSYVVAEPENSVMFRSQTGADHVLAEIKTIVEEDKRQLLRRLRRCQSLAPSMDELSSRASFPSWPSALARSDGTEDVEGPGRSSDGVASERAGTLETQDRKRGAEDSRRRPVSPPFYGPEEMERRGRERENDRRRREREERAKESEEEKQRRATVAGPRPDGERDAPRGGLRANRVSPVTPLLRREPSCQSPVLVRGARGGAPFSLPCSYAVETESVSAANRSEAGDSPLLVSGIRRKRENPGLLSLQSMGDFRRRTGREREEDDGSVSSSANWSWREEEERSRAVLNGRGASDEMLRGCSVSSSEWKDDDGREERDATLAKDGAFAASGEVLIRKSASRETHAYRRKGGEEGGRVMRTFGSSEHRFSSSLWKALKKRPRASSLPSLVFSAALDKCERHMKAIRRDLILAQFRGWNLDVWRRNSNEMEIFFLLALDDLGLLERREEKKLRHFFTIIRDGYHTDNPYHNFYHAIHVFQVCWMFLSTYGCRNILSPVEQLGILLAALCHDVDHPGVNNAFLRASLHPLSIMYNDKAVLENHHAAFAVRTMMELSMYGAGSRCFPAVGGSAAPASPEGKTGSCGSRVEGGRIVPSFAELRKIVIQAIFSTDMELFRQHHDAMKRRAQMKTRKKWPEDAQMESWTEGWIAKPADREELEGEDDRNLLVTCLIHCADICNPVMSEGRNIQWASLVTQEFNAQVDLEKRYGLPVSVFMDARTELQRTQSQIGFLSFVVLDQFRALADLIPEVSELVIQGEKNLEMWQRALDTLKAAEEAEKAGERYEEELPNNFSFRLKDLKFTGMRGVKCFGFIQCEEYDGCRPPSLDV